MTPIHTPHLLFSVIVFCCSFEGKKEGVGGFMDVPGIGVNSWDTFSHGELRWFIISHLGVPLVVGRYRRIILSE